MKASDAVAGAITAGFGVVELVRPVGLVRGLHMTEHPEIAARLRVLSRVWGVRDILSGAFMAFARSDRQLQLAYGLRGVFDAADGVLYLVALPPPAPKRFIALVEGGLALTSAFAVLAIQRRRR